MLDQFQTITLLGVLEFDGLICIESGVARTTPRFHESLVAARRAKRIKMDADLRESIAQAMHRLYGKYLSESEMLSLVDAMLPIAAAEPAPKRPSPRARG